MLFAFSIAPAIADQDGSVHVAVTDAIEIVRASGLPHRTDAMFTTLEGDWEECLAVIKACAEAVGRHSPRVSLVLKADLRPGRTGELTGKVERVEAELARRADEPGHAG